MTKLRKKTNVDKNGGEEEENFRKKNRLSRNFRKKWPKNERKQNWWNIEEKKKVEYCEKNKRRMFEC